MSSEPSTEPLFAASRIKVERAKAFIAELQAEQDRYAAHGIRAKIVIEGGEPKLNLDWDGAGLMPGAILGDAIHNLRTALDLMASELAVLADRDPNKTYFPFGTSLDDLRDSDKFKAFAKCGTDCVETLEKIAPYRGGNEALRAMHDLDIQDKHKALIVSKNETDFSVTGDFFPDRPDDHTLVPKIGKTEFNFPEGSPLAGEPIVPTLHNLTETVEGILEAFTSLVAARAQSSDIVRD